MAFVAMTLFFRTEMHRRKLDDGSVYMGALFFAIIIIMFNGFSELALTILKLPVFYKQRDFLFFPPWAYSLPTWILKIPITFVEVGIWVVLTYYVIGFDPNAGRWEKMKNTLNCKFDYYLLDNIRLYDGLADSSSSFSCSCVWTKWHRRYSVWSGRWDGISSLQIHLDHLLY